MDKSTYSTCLCVCECACVCVRVCARAYMQGCMCTHVWVCMHVCVWLLWFYLDMFVWLSTHRVYKHITCVQQNSLSFKYYCLVHKNNRDTHRATVRFCTFTNAVVYHMLCKSTKIPLKIWAVREKKAMSWYTHSQNLTTLFTCLHVVF